MSDSSFTQGQHVNIIPLAGIDAAADRRISAYAGMTGTVEKSWCLARDEMPDLVKMVVYPDVWCCDVRLDGTGEVVRGIPEAALERRLPRST